MKKSIVLHPFLAAHAAAQSRAVYSSCPGGSLRPQAFPARRRRGFSPRRAVLSLQGIKFRRVGGEPSASMAARISAISRW